MQRIFFFRKSEDGEQKEMQQKTLQTIEKWLAAEKGFPCEKFAWEEEERRNE